MQKQKICKIHGELDESDILVEKSKKMKEGIQLRCRFCKLEKDRRFKSNHREKMTAYSVKWKRENREHYNEWLKKDRKENPEKYRRYEQTYITKHGLERVRRSEVLRIHGLTKAQHDEMILKQNNLCAICHNVETRISRNGKSVTPLCIDHDHGTQKIRGLLCHACNIAIGKFKDDIELIQKAIDYLKYHAKPDTL